MKIQTKITVGDIMKSPVAATVPYSDVGYAREIMDKKEISAIVVVDEDDVRLDENKIRGIVTSTDLRGVTEATWVGKVMSNDLHLVSSDMDISEAAQVMMQYHVHHLLVAEGGEIRGVISSMDFVKIIAESGD